MTDEDFQKLVLSVTQMGTIIQGGKLAHWQTTLTDLIFLAPNQSFSSQ